MNPVEHALIGWCVATLPRESSARDRLLITAAAVVPDVDGLGMLVEIPTRNTDHPILWWTDYHHIITHNVGAAIVVTIAAMLVANDRWRTAAFALVSFHTHIVGDIVGARGPDGYGWPIPYFLPFSRTPELSWDGQWPLNGWQNFVITGIALTIVFVVAVRRGYSPVEIISRKADHAFVATLRNRFGHAA